MISSTALAALSVGRFDEGLGDDGVEPHAEKALGLFAHFGGQGIDHAVDGLGGTGRMQGAENEVTGFGRRHGHGNRFRIAHFADEDHVRVFPQGRADAFRETRQVRVQFPLHDLAALALVHKFDRVFEADDIEISVPVDVVDHRRKCRGFARSGRARHEHHALVMITELRDDAGHLQAVERRNVLRDEAECRADPGGLAKHIDPEAATVFGDI